MTKPARSDQAGRRSGLFGCLAVAAWTAEDGSARPVVEAVADELAPSLRWGDGHHGQGDESARDSTVQERPVKGA